MLLLFYFKFVDSRRIAFKEENLYGIRHCCKLKIIKDVALVEFIDQILKYRKHHLPFIGWSIRRKFS